MVSLKDKSAATVQDIRDGIRDLVAHTVIEQSGYAGGQPVLARDMEPAIAFYLGQYIRSIGNSAKLCEALGSVNLAAGKQAVAAALLELS
jgi:hypothetical protein